MKRQRNVYTCILWKVNCWKNKYAANKSRFSYIRRLYPLNRPFVSGSLPWRGRGLFSHLFCSFFFSVSLFSAHFLFFVVKYPLMFSRKKIFHCEGGGGVYCYFLLKDFLRRKKRSFRILKLEEMRGQGGV